MKLKLKRTRGKNGTASRPVVLKKNGTAAKYLILFLPMFTFTAWAAVLSFDLRSIEDRQLKFDNPWLYLKAIQTSYPEIAGGFFFDSEVNDWCIRLRDEDIYWAHGRLLRKSDMHNWQNWNPVFSYLYPETVPNPKDYPEPMLEALSFERLVRRRKAEPAPNYTFNTLIYRGSTKAEISRRLKKLKFLNKQIWVHGLIAEPLKRVEKRIYAARKTDPAVRAFLKELRSCWGFNWRTIADSGKLSNHSWGSAIDVLPKNYRAKKIYWLWEAQNNKNWTDIQPGKRWSPPPAVVEAFESEGFIWGGKWDLWDNMHFEYRPELLYVRTFLASEAPYGFSVQAAANKKGARTGETGTVRSKSRKTKAAGLPDYAKETKALQTFEQTTEEDEIWNEKNGGRFD